MRTMCPYGLVQIGDALPQARVNLLIMAKVMDCKIIISLESNTITATWYTFKLTGSTLYYVSLNDSYVGHNWILLSKYWTGIK